MLRESTLDRTHQTRILVVDDEAEVRLLLAQEIGERGHEVVVAADSAQAMEEMGRGDFDVVLTDIRMPGMDGMDLTEWIKRTRPDTAVTVMTGYASVDSAATAVRLGAFDYLLKPFGEMDLVTSSIDRAIQKRRLEEELRWSVEELRASRASFRSVVEKNSDGVVIVDRRGNVRFANPAVGTLLNCKVEELVGGLFGLSVVAGETTEHEIIGRGGERRVTEMHVVETEWEGEMAYLASLRDITEPKRAENQLKQTVADLARSNAELQQFAYVASHDLQEPLRMVSSYVTLLEQRYKDKLDADADEFITYAVDGAKRMYTLINDLLAYSRVGTCGREFEPTACEAVLATTLANLKAPIEENEAVVTHDPLPSVMANETQLVQLFQNLIGNALKFRGEHPPQIHVSAQKTEEFRDSSSTSQVAKDDGLEISTQQSAIQNPNFKVGNPKSAIGNPQSSEWVFSVRDNGIGIDPEHAKRIFVIFQRLHGKGEYSGTGIGLAVCKKIVERHRGRIWVESEPRQGTTFYFTIPDHGGSPL